MSSIFPLRESVSLEKREPRLVELDEDTADEVFEALSSGTTRQIFLELHESPQTTSDLAEAVDTSVQNAQYHLEKLQEAELVEIVDTWYSERGSEMKVFAPKDESLVLFAGRNKQHALRRLLDRIVGALGVLVPSSALVGLATHWHNVTTSDGSSGGATGGSADGGDGGAGGDDTADGDPDRQSTDSGDGDVDTTESGTDGGDGSTDGGTEDTTDGGDGTDGGDLADQDVADSDFAEASDNISNISDGVSDANESLDGGVEAAEAAASVDPLFAAALFFFGGLFLFLMVTMWYGPGLGLLWD